MHHNVRQIDAIDARHRWRVRAMTFFGAAILITVAMWAADFRVGQFDLARVWHDVKDWWHQEWYPQKDERHAVAPQLPTPVAVNSTQSKEPPKPLLGLESSISKTPQALVLVSTARGRNAREGTARLGTHPENPQTYAAGAILANGARLLEIFDDHIVLERDGKQTKLYLQSSGKKTTSDLLKVGGETQQVKAPVATHTEILTDYIRPSPVYDGQTIHGYQVYAGQKSGVVAQMRLQNGDVICRSTVNRSWVPSRPLTCSTN